MKAMKKLVSCVLVLATMFALSVSAFAAQPPTADPQYVNVKSASVSLSIDSSGKALVDVWLSGNADVTKVVATTYVEKKVGNTWVRVNIGTTNNIWQYIGTRSVMKTYTAQLSGSGEYRAYCTFAITASTSETIYCSNTDSY